MKILITGGLGYLGGRIANYLTQNNYKVKVASRNSFKPNSFLENISMYQIDWNNESSINKACEDCNVIIHAAGMNSHSCYANPDEALKFNGFTTAKLLNNAISCGVSNFIYFSTAHVYADKLVGFYDETSPTTNQHPYATSHKFGEEALIEASKTGKINGIVLRLSNAFGSPIDPNSNCWPLLVNDLCKQAVTSNKIKLLTSGTQYRNFLPIIDLCKIVTFFLTYKNQDYNLYNPVYNVGSKFSMSVYDMALTISQYYEEIYGHKLIIQKKPISLSEQNSNDKELIYSIDKLTKLLGTSFFSFKEEIKNLFNFCENHY